MATDTDPILYCGVGATLPLGDGWQMRLDVRQGFMPARAGGRRRSTRAWSASACASARAAPAHASAAPGTADPPPVGSDATATACPTARRVPDQRRRRGADGCPIADPTRRHLGRDRQVPRPARGQATASRTPTAAPTPTTTATASSTRRTSARTSPRPATATRTTTAARTRSRPRIVAAFEAATAVRFEPGHARLTRCGEDLAREGGDPAAREPDAARVRDRASRREGRCRRRPSALAQKRAEAVKWYLVDQGVPADQIETATGSPAEKGRVIELRVGAASPH